MIDIYQLAGLAGVVVYLGAYGLLQLGAVRGNGYPYALMNLMMTSTPLAVVGCGFSNAQSADIVMAHVLAMFAPSFFTGNLIQRFGTMRIIAAGLVGLALAERLGDAVSLYKIGQGKLTGVGLALDRKSDV